MSTRFKRFQTLRDQNRKGLVPFITAGDLPHDKTIELMHQLVARGADVI